MQHVGAAPSAAGGDGDAVTIKVSSVLDGLDFAGKALSVSELVRMVGAYNTDSSFTGPAALTVNRATRALTIPGTSVRTFFRPCIKETLAKIGEILEESERAGATPISFIIIAGGFAESPLLSKVRNRGERSRHARFGTRRYRAPSPQAIKERYNTAESARDAGASGGARRCVLLPMNPRKMVVAGAIPFGMQHIGAVSGADVPVAVAGGGGGGASSATSVSASIVGSRIAEFNYGFIGAEPYNPAVHGPDAPVFRQGDFRCVARRL